MAERRAKIRFYVVKKHQVRDPAWPAPGDIPVNWLLNGAPLEYSAAKSAVVSRSGGGLAGLTRGQGGTAYLPDQRADENDPEPDLHFCEIVDQTNDAIHLRFWFMRMSGLPSRHDRADGSTTPLELAKTQGLAEATEVVLFPPYCLAGILINRSGPRQLDIRHYIEAMTGVHLWFSPLVREESLSLVEPSLVRNVEVEVAAGHFEALADLSPELGQAAASVARRGVRAFRVSVTAVPNEAASMWSSFSGPLRRLVARGRAGGVSRLAVGQAGQDHFTSHAVDLLEQQVGFEATVPLQTGRTVDAEAGRKAIVDAYNQHLRLIKRCVELDDPHEDNMRGERKKPKRKPKAERQEGEVP